MEEKKVVKKLSKLKTKKSTLGKKKLSTLLTPEKSLAKAIETIKNSDYKGTHIKVELEADFDREWTEDDCQEWLLENVSEEAANSVVYSCFYDDGSVDSEFTFTVPIDKPHVVIEFIQAFKQLASVAGSGTLDVEGAGMHIAILNSRNGDYPGGNQLDPVKVRNFSISMTKLLPALYFLGTGNAISRSLHFREPCVCSDSGASHRGKYMAVNHLSNVFEYRVFDTCYDKPEVFYDYLCVIAKTMKFYSSKLVKVPFAGKIGELVFSDDGFNLTRFYTTIKHIEALDLGLKLLKPDHKTIKQLKKERGFTVTKDFFEKREKKLVHEWKAEYSDEEKKMKLAIERFKASLEQWLDENTDVLPPTITRNNFIKDQLETWITTNFGFMTDEEKFINKKRQDVARASSGKNYTIVV